MGCDIHGIFQKKVGDVWEDIPSDYEFNRHYQLFSALAGVRGGWGEDPIDYPRGLPLDFKTVTETDEDGNESPNVYLVKDSSFLSPWRRENYPDDLDVWMGDHSHSWLTAEEMLGWHDDFQDERLAYFFDEVRRLQKEHGEVRFVFGFDS